MVRWASMVTADADGTRHVVPLAGDGPPDLSVVEALARYQLMIRRAGGRMWLKDLSPANGTTWRVPSASAVTMLAHRTMPAT